MFPDNEDWLHGPDSNHDLDWLHRRGEMRRKPPVMAQVTISIGADISCSQQMVTDQVVCFIPNKSMSIFQQTHVMTAVTSSHSRINKKILRNAKVN